MRYVVRRLQRMDLSFFHVHGASAAGRQRAINIDGWLIPYLSIPASTTLTLRFRHVDSGRLTAEPHPFGRLQKNFRIHGRMIQGNGYSAFSMGDIMLMRFVGQTVTFGIFRDTGVERPVFRFLDSTSNVVYRRNMGIVNNANRIRDLEELLATYDAPLFFADEVEALDADPSSTIVHKFVKRRVTPEAYKKIKRACEENGEKGEKFILDRERKRLVDAGHPDLATRIVHVAAVAATGPYDIQSFEGIAPDPDRERFIEVKSTSGDGMEFEMSEAEWQFADAKRDQHVICRVTQVTSDNPKCREVRDIVGHHSAGHATRRPVAFKVNLV
jgi:hypothetical protein